MPGNIKGITVEFRGDTTKLDKAIRTVEKETRSLDSELRKVNNALKFNPTSVDLWREKQTLLTKKIGETEEKLKLLKQQQKAMDDAGVDKTSLEYQKLQREIIETESKLKAFKAELKSIGQVNLRAASEQFKQLGTSLENAGQKMKGLSTAGAAVVAMFGALSYKAGQWADDLNTMSKVTGISTGELQKYAASAELVDVDVETIAKSHSKLTKQMNAARDGTGASAEAFAALGVSVTDADGNLRNADDVWMDTIEALGRMENETERDALAMQLMGKSAQELNPLIKDGGKTYQQTAELFEKYNLDFVDQATLDRANEFNDQIDRIKALGLIAFQQLGAQLAGYLAPALEKVVDWVGRLANWLSNLDPELLTIIAAVGGFVAVLAPLLIGLGKVSFAISSILGLMATLGPAIAAFNPVILAVIAVIGALVVIGVQLYKNWDTIKAKATALWTSVKTTFTNIKNSIASAFNAAKNAVTNAVNSIRTKVVSTFNAVRSSVASIWNGIKTAITSPIQSAVNFVRNAISRIRSILSGRISLPHIKLPHFSITGRFSLNPPSVPHFGVNWYKTGGIFDGPSVIGVGEAGSEAVIPLDTLWEKLDNIAAASGSVAPVINVYPPAGSDAYAIAKEVQKILVRLEKQEAKAWG